MIHVSLACSVVHVYNIRESARNIDVYHIHMYSVLVYSGQNIICV